MQCGKMEHALHKAAVLKAEGNAAYKAKEFTSAIRNYHKALLMLRSVDMTVATEFHLLQKCLQPKDPSPSILDDDCPQEMIVARDKLESECNNNLAACLLARPEPKYQRVVDCCEKVLRHDAANVKATYRMGMALFHLGQLKRAREVLTAQPQFKYDMLMEALLKSIGEEENKVESEKAAVEARAQEAKLSAQMQKPDDPRLIQITRTLDKPREEPRNKNDAANLGGPKLIHVASADKEAAC